MLLLIVGAYKTGKSVSASTFPKPILWLDWEDGFKSIESVKPQFVKDIHRIQFYKDKIVDLDFTSDLGKKGSPIWTGGSTELISDYNKIIRELEKTGAYIPPQIEVGLGDLTIPLTSSPPFKPKTLVIDSLTSMFRIWKENILVMNGVSTLRIQDYATLENVLFGQFIPALKTLLINGILDHIVLVDHLDSDKDEITGMLSEFPVGPSRNMGKQLGMAFDDIYLQKQEGQDYVWKTRKFGLFQAGSRLNVPETIKPADYNELVKYIIKKP